MVWANVYTTSNPPSIAARERRGSGRETEGNGNRSGVGLAFWWRCRHLVIASFLLSICHRHCGMCLHGLCRWLAQLPSVTTCHTPAIGSLVGLERGWIGLSKQTLKLSSNSTCSTAALTSWHCRIAALPGQNSGTAASADNFESQFKISEYKLGSEKFLSFLQIWDSHIES